MQGVLVSGRGEGSDFRRSPCGAHHDLRRVSPSGQSLGAPGSTGSATRRGVETRERGDPAGSYSRLAKLRRPVETPSPAAPPSRTPGESGRGARRRAPTIEACGGASPSMASQHGVPARPPPHGPWARSASENKSATANARVGRSRAPWPQQSRALGAADASSDSNESKKSRRSAADSLLARRLPARGAVARLPNGAHPGTIPSARLAKHRARHETRRDLASPPATQIGIQSLAVREARAKAKAIPTRCRHSLRALDKPIHPRSSHHLARG